MSLPDYQKAFYAAHRAVQGSRLINGDATREAWDSAPVRRILEYVKPSGEPVADLCVCGPKTRAERGCECEPTEPETILHEADRLVRGDRRSAYGHPLDDFGKVQGMAKLLWGRGPETEEEHAIYMILVKLSREANQHKRDNLVDIAGYIKTIELIHEERGRRTV